LSAAGFSDIVVVDAGADLNAYAKVEGQSGCCSPAMALVEKPAASACCTPAKSLVTLPVSSACCSPAPAAEAATVHDGLARLLDRYDVNEYAASVKVYAVKPNA
jgi:arsenite methyltransferase